MNMLGIGARTILPLVALLASGTASAQLVDDWSANSPSPVEIATDGTNLWSVGVVRTPLCGQMQQASVVRKGTWQRGRWVWSVVDQYQGTGCWRAEGRRIAVAGSTIFEYVRTAPPGAMDFQVLLRKSANAGKSWSTVTKWQDGTNITWTDDLEIDGSTIWMSGRSQPTLGSAETPWLRVSFDGGKTWKPTVRPPGANVLAWDATTRTLWVAGMEGAITKVGRSLDRGLTWELVYEYQSPVAPTSTERALRPQLAVEAGTPVLAIAGWTDASGQDALVRLVPSGGTWVPTAMPMPPGIDQLFATGGRIFAAFADGKVPPSLWGTALDLFVWNAAAGGWQAIGDVTEFGQVGARSAVQLNGNLYLLGGAYEPASQVSHWWVKAISLPAP